MIQIVQHSLSSSLHINSLLNLILFKYEKGAFLYPVEKLSNTVMGKKCSIRYWGMALKAKIRLRFMPLPELAWLVNNCSVPDTVFITCDDILFHEYRFTPSDESSCYCFRKALLRVVPIEELDSLINNLYH